MSRHSFCLSIQLCQYEVVPSLFHVPGSLQIAGCTSSAERRVKGLLAITERIFMLSDAYSPVYFVFIAATAFLTSHIFNRLFGFPTENRRESALDGLRGFLVIGVFVHHAAFWVSKKGGGAWKIPDGVLSTLGPVCVILFFMTTAFLYYGKLLRARGKKIDWLHISLSRVLRLMPLCILMAVAAFVVALFIKGFVINENVFTLLQSFLCWVSPGLGGSPDINGLKSSWQINAGVVWTLKYELLFYVCLPLFGILALIELSVIALAVSFLLAMLIILTIPVSELKLATAFLGGIVASYAIQKVWITNMCRTPIAAVIFLGCVGSVIFSHRNAYGAVSLMLLTIAFVIVACGNDIFGILSLRSVRSFGDIGYSAYLLHGLLLYLAFHSENVAYFDGSLNPIKHWSIVAGIAVLLVFVCRLTFKYVEQPAMNAEPSLRAQIRKLLKQDKLVLQP